jgi:PKD repeat protein
LQITYTINGINPTVVLLANGQNSVNQTINNIITEDTVRITNIQVFGANDCNYAYVDSLMPTLILTPAALPQASITLPADSICNGQTAYFLLGSVGGNNQDWTVFYKLNGQTNTVLIPAFVNQAMISVPNATANQILEINRIVNTVTGCQTVYTAANAPIDTVVVSPKPAVSFTNYVVSLGKLQFTSLANAAEIATWEWDFGDGSTSNDTNPVHLYAGSATYDVCLKVTSIYGCENTYCRSIVVNTVVNMVADYNINNDEQCLTGNAFTFINTSTITTAGYYIDKYYWDYGDGTTDTTRHGYHVYATAGTYLVKLVITEAPGLSSDSVTKVVRALAVPTITDGLAPAPVCNGSLLSVNQPTITWNGNNPTTGNWTLNGVLFDPLTTPVYFANDKDTLRYHVATPCGDAVSEGVLISVVSSLVLNPVPELVICSGDTLNFTPTTTEATAVITWERVPNALVAQVPTSGSGTINERLTSLSSNPLQVYYNVTINFEGCTSSTQVITAIVNPIPALNSSTDPQTICYGDQFVYSAQSSTYGATFSWTRDAVAGNAAASGSTNYINETLINSTDMPVVAKYFITTAYGACSTTDSISVTINPLIVITSNLAPDSICSGTFFNYDITASVPNADFTWNRLPNANIVEPASSGIFSLITEQLTSRSTSDVFVTYVVKASANGCQSAATNVVVKVKALPTLNIITPTPLIMIINDVKPVEIATNGTLVGWTSSNNAVATIDSVQNTEVVVTAVAEGIVTMTLTVENESGCRYEQSFIVNINAADVATMNLAAGQSYEFCSNETVNFEFVIAGGNAPYHIVYAQIQNGDTIYDTINNVLQSVQHITEILPQNTENGIDTIVFKLVSVIDANNHSLDIVENDIILSLLPYVRIDNIKDVTVCEGDNVQIEIFTTPTRPTTSVYYEWYNNNPSIGLTGNGHLAQGDTIPVFAAINTMNIPAHALVTVTAYFQGTTKVCQGETGTLGITVNPQPKFTVTDPQAICAGSDYNPNDYIPYLIQNLSPTTADLTFYTDPSCTDTIHVGDAFVVNANTIIYARAAFKECTSVVRPIFITVQSLDLLSQTHLSLCSTSTLTYTASSTGNPISYTWERPAVLGLSNPANSGTGANITETLTLDNNVSTYVSVKYYITIISASCSKVDTLQVDVYPSAHLTKLRDTICSGSTIDYTPDAGVLTAATVFSWTRLPNTDIVEPSETGIGNISEVLTNKTIYPVLVTYEITMHTGSCEHTENYRVLVNPTPGPAVANQHYPAVCSGSTFSTTVSSIVSGTTYTWQRIHNDAVLDAPNMAAHTGNIIKDTLTNLTNDVATVFYAVTYDSKGCIFYDTISVDVNPLPIMTSNPNPDAVCSASPFAYMVETSPNTTITLMRGVNSNIAELPTTGSSKMIAEVLTNTSATTTTVYYTIYLNNGLCSNIDTVAVEVLPYPTVNEVHNVTVCNGDSITIAPNGNATKYVIGSASSIGLNTSVEVNQGDEFKFEAVNLTSSSITAVVTVTPIYTSAGSNCVGLPETFNITVNPVPDVASVEDMAFCAGTAVSSYQFTGSIASANYVWKRVAGDVITSLPSQGVNALPAFTANNMTNDFLVATYELVANYSYNGVTCSSVKDSFDITVYNIPKVNAIEDVELCATITSDTIFFSGSNNTTYSWTKISGLNIGSPLSGVGQFIPDFVPINTNTNVRTAVYEVTPIIENTSCEGSARTFTISVNPIATLSSARLGDSLCSGSTFTYTATSATPSVTFSWVRPAIAGINNATSAANTGNIINEVLFNNSDAVIMVPYYITLSYEACDKVDTIFVPVKPIATLSFDISDYIICQGESPLVLNFTMSSTTLPVEYKIVFSANAEEQGIFSMPSYQPLTSTSSLSINIPRHIQPGVYMGYIYIQTNSCSSATPYQFSFTVLETSIITKEPAAVTTLCLEYDPLYLEVVATGSNIGYQWYHNGDAITGANSPFYEVITPTEADYGEYFVVVSGDCGNDTSIISRIVPSFVQIGMFWTDYLYVMNNDTSYTSGLEFAYYQWYKWNENSGKFVPIYRNSDAQGFSDPTGINGTYMVEVFYTNGMSYMSCPVTYIKEPEEQVSSMIYPNPIVNEESLFVRVGNDIINNVDYSKITIEITNLVGEVIYRFVPTGETTEIRPRLTSGVYNVKVRNNTGKVLLTTKLVVK